jgi:hypothetical protein
MQNVINELEKNIQSYQELYEECETKDELRNNRVVIAMLQNLLRVAKLNNY